MLQQTQVSRVVEYFTRWMDTLPTVEAVATAPEEELLKLWEGLGYYSRVRNIHKAAKYIVKKWSGSIPSSVEQLLTVPGLGPYTANAIVCFAYKKKASPLDANIIRVLARVTGYEERVDTAKGKKHLEKQLELWVPEKDPHLVAEGLIEFGQKVCTKAPNCNTCPLRHECLGKSKVGTIPKKKPPKEAVFLEREIAVVVSGRGVWVYKESQGKVMHGLWQFPYGERGFCKKKPFTKYFVGEMNPIKHTFTNHRVTLYPRVFVSEEKAPFALGKWIPLDEIATYTFSSGHRTIAHMLANKKFMDSLHRSLLSYSP